MKLKHIPKLIILIFCLAMLLVLSGGGCGSTEDTARFDTGTTNDSVSDETTSVDADVDEAVEEEADKKPTAPDVPNFSQGMYLVGTDIKPGLYRTEGPITYFERLAGLSGELKDIITNEAFPSGPVVIEIRPSDVAFKSDGRGVWYLVDESYQPEIRTEFSDGLWIVGVDIEPGQYRTQDDVTYYARLSGFTGELSDIIINEAFSSGGAIIEIRASDAGFQTQGGATWTKIN